MNFDLIKRDIILAFRTRGDWLMGIMFFTLFLAMSVIALGSHTHTLEPLAPALVWLAFSMSALLSFGQIFAEDYADGTLAQTLIFNGNFFEIVLSKLVAYIATALLPLWLAIPIAGLFFDLPATMISGLMLAVLLGMPAIGAYGIFASALTVSKGASGVLIVLICVPFLIPILIFGISAAEIYSVEGLMSAPYKALLGLSLIGCAIAIPAASASIKTSFE